MAEKFYVTTAIDYVNAAPHIGHAYQKIVADALARWNRLLGKDVLFVTGTDEHGKKVQESAAKAKVPVKKFVDGIARQFKEAWKALDVVPDRFIRTTDKDHKETVAWFIKQCDKAKDIYKGTYSGLYCTGCEAYYAESDAVEGNCPLHHRPLEKIEEESYFFKLSKYQKFLLKQYREHPEFVLPSGRRNEIVKRVGEGLHDLSITRTSFDWGIPFPLDKTHVTYVWFDALINYYTATREKRRGKFWGAPTVHILGKDNAWFHTVYWPAMLESAGLALPKTTINHGFLTFNGQKISKSLGNAISPVTLAEKYGSDSVRYFCLRHFSFMGGSDGDFDEVALVDRHNNELANKYGNLVSRVTSLAEKYGLKAHRDLITIDFENVKRLLDGYEVDKALNEIFAYVDRLNEFLQDRKPWETQDSKVLYAALVGIRDATILLSAFIPKAAEKVAKHLGFSLDLRELGKPFKVSKVKKAPILFEKLVAPKPKLNKSDAPPEIMEGVTTIEFADFEKIDLRVGEIHNVEDIEGADKLYKLTVGLGEEVRTICAGIKEYYNHDQLKSKKVIVLTNLAPRKLRGIESQGMLLAAGSKESNTCSLLTVDSEAVEPGTRIS